MIKKFLTSLPIILLVSAIGIGTASAGDRQDTDISSQRDSAVSSLLLAAGMYGLDLQDDQGTSLSLSQSKNLFKGLPAVRGQLDGRNITLSYSGSSGRLGFSAGYIYTYLQENQEPGTILLGLDSINHNPFENNNPWYLAFDLSKSFQISDNIAIGVDSKTMLMKTPLDDQDGRMLSMLLSLPMSYMNFFTITPELQWSRSLPDTTAHGNSNNFSKQNSAEDKDVFYGGMSISFSY